MDFILALKGKLLQRIQLCDYIFPAHFTPDYMLSSAERVAPSRSQPAIKISVM